MTQSTSPRSDRPLVSHFVYAYRQERTIRAAIESVFAQTYGPLEIILSDDCSPDGTYAVMEEMAAAYRGPHRIVLNRNPLNLGISRHVERIMELASGAFVIESGGDDVSLPHRDERLVEAWLASGRQARLVHSALTDVDEDGLPMAPRPGAIPPLETMAPARMLDRPRSYGLIGATAGWTPDLYTRFGPVSDLASFHDYPLAFRALLLGGEILYVDEPLVRYSRGGVSRTRNKGYGHHWYLFGDHLRYLRWDLEFFRCHRRDMEQVPPLDPERCRALCEAWMRKADLMLDFAGRSLFGRIAGLPGAAAASLRHRQPVLLSVAAKYALGEKLARRLDARQGRDLLRDTPSGDLSPSGHDRTA